MTKKIATHIKADDVVELDKEPPSKVIKFENQPWACPVCGLNRRKGNHQECSKIMQLKRQEERAKMLINPLED